MAINEGQGWTMYQAIESITDQLGVCVGYVHVCAWDMCMCVHVCNMYVCVCVAKCVCWYSGAATSLLWSLLLVPVALILYK